MREDPFSTTAISDYRASVENVELSPPDQDASPDDNSRTPLTISFWNVTGMKPYPELSPNQLTLRIACGTEKTL
ncbi:hypothetical protein TNCV_4385301 [Trichonephila clavipes]|nr:hypothetical protein TNCV_4385301 [Trichonephila clavipes]